MCDARARGDRRRARRASRPASRSRTAASTASRCRAASPTRDEVEALFLAAGEAGKGVVLITPGEQCTYADVYEWQPRDRPAVHLPAVRAPGRQAPRAARAARAGHRGRRAVWPQVTPRPLTMQFTMADPYSLNTGTVFGELLQGEPRRAHRRLPRPGVAGPRRGRPRAVADEAALGDVRGLRVGAVPRARGPAGDRARARARLQPARRDVRARGRRGPDARASGRTSPTTTSTRSATC